MSTYARAPRRSKGRRPPLDPLKGVMSKAARHAKIITLLEQREVRSQSELAELLADDGVQVTQGTLSRDLLEIGALRVRSSGGHLVYAVPGEGGDRTPHVGETRGGIDRDLAVGVLQWNLALIGVETMGR
jgi:hypothetical protein